MTKSFRLASIAAALVSGLCALPAAAQENVLNLYSARHYQTDEALYDNFTKSTGIRINRIEAGDEALLERLSNEGANSPADVVLLVDAARLAKAQAAGLFQPVQLEAARGAHPRQPARPRRLVVRLLDARAHRRLQQGEVKPQDVDTYEELADPKNKGSVCTRSGAHPYQLSLAAAR